MTKTSTKQHFILKLNYFSVKTAHFSVGSFVPRLSVKEKMLYYYSSALERKREKIDKKVEREDRMKRSNKRRGKRKEEKGKEREGG